MPHTIYITGGARSGKSRYAEQRAVDFGSPLAYIATARALDGEMQERITRHQQRRGEAWQTFEEPLQLTETLSSCDGRFRAILVDCLTLWLSNLLFRYEDHDSDAEEQCLEQVRRLATTLQGMTTPVILVSNEVGMGIVPENRLARIFRDIAGQAGQIIAASADEAWLVASGIPLKLK